MIKKCAISAFAFTASCAYAGFGGMGNVEGEGGSDVSLQEMLFMLIGLAIVYGVMKKTSIGQSVEDYCGTFWGMIVLCITALFVIGVTGALMRS